MKKINFTKMEGIGNDYVYINSIQDRIDLTTEQIQFISNRHYGVGSDGVIFIRPSTKADCRMEMYNSDGSYSEMCGNGLRCVSKYIFDHGIVRNNNPKIETDKGVLDVQIHPGEDGLAESVTINMGNPILESTLIPAIFSKTKIISEPLKIEDKEFQITCVSMGNPHTVIYVEDTKNFPVHKYGSIIENHSMFPKRTNVEFVTVVNRTHVIQRTWERGAGETLACGSGACAVLVASVLNQKTEKKIRIDLSGGSLEIFWSEDNYIYMTGPAKEVFSGVITI